MNHTAHCLLSYPDPDVLLGNFIGDFIKGKAWNQYPAEVQRGILLHRTIDSFTDNHPATRRSVGRIRAFAGPYAPPLVDILFDHLLCLNWKSCAPIPFDPFAQWAYTELERRKSQMPAPLQRRWPHMRAGRFLHGYQTREGLDWVLGQFTARLKRNIDPLALSAAFFENIDPFHTDFQEFFPALQQRVGLELD
ncbi:MAG: DUF479 domain-containing protein [Saprospiraceae bacterium]|nr:DUF479 domain-containing protein [Saprospiraceae bacterium]